MFNRDEIYFLMKLVEKSVDTPSYPPMARHINKVELLKKLQDQWINEIHESKAS